MQTSASLDPPLWAAASLASRAQQGAKPLEGNILQESALQQQL